jgi:hypothetical protein
MPEKLSCNHTVCPYNDHTEGSLRADVSNLQEAVADVRVSQSKEIGDLRLEMRTGQIELKTMLSTLIGPEGKIAIIERTQKDIESKQAEFEIWKTEQGTAQGVYWKIATYTGWAVNALILLAMKFWHRI